MFSSLKLCSGSAPHIKHVWWGIKIRTEQPRRSGPRGDVRSVLWGSGFPRSRCVFRPQPETPAAAGGSYELIVWFFMVCLYLKTLFIKQTTVSHLWGLIFPSYNYHTHISIMITMFNMLPPAVNSNAHNSYLHKSSGWKHTFIISFQSWLETYSLTHIVKGGKVLTPFLIVVKVHFLIYLYRHFPFKHVGIKT